MNSKRAISELEQIYGILSPDKQMAIDEAIKALETVERIEARRRELEKKMHSSFSLTEAHEHYALTKLLREASEEDG